MIFALMLAFSKFHSRFARPQRVKLKITIGTDIDGEYCSNDWTRQDWITDSYLEWQTDSPRIMGELWYNLFQH